MVNELNTYMREELVREVSGFESFVVVGYMGLNAEETLSLRRNVRSQSLRLRMVPNRIARIVFEEAGIAGLDQCLEGPSALISGSDPIELSKAVAGFQKDTKEKLQIKGAFVQGQVLDRGAVNRLSKTPPREVLLAKIIGSIQSPVTKVVRCIKSPVENMARLINAVAEKKQGEEN